MAEYSEQVIDHFMHPRNVGVIENADGYGKIGNPVCGDIMELYLKVNDDGIIEDAKFRTFGCAAAIATTSIVTEMIKNQHVDKAMDVTMNTIAQALGGLPKQKMHCSNGAAGALRQALEDYKKRKVEKQSA